MNKKLIDLVDLSGIVDVYQKIEISYEYDGAASYIGTIMLPISVMIQQITKTAKAVRTMCLSLRRQIEGHTNALIVLGSYLLSVSRVRRVLLNVINVVRNLTLTGKEN